MSLKKLSIALGVVFALSAVMASGAFAAATTPSTSFWYVGKTKLASGETRALKCSAATGFTLTSEVLGIPIKITATGEECPGGQIEQTSSSMAEDSGKIKFTGVKMVEPAGCTVPSTLETEALKSRIDEEGTTVYDRFAPATGTVFITIPVSGCAVAGSQPVEGTVYGKSPNLTGVLKTNQQLVFSGAINKTAGGSLSFAGEPAALEGTANNELSAGGEFKANAS